MPLFISKWYCMSSLSLCRVTSTTIFSLLWVCSTQSSQRALHVTSRIEVVLQPLERSENGAYLLQLILKRHKKWLFSPSQVHKHLLTFSKMVKRVSKKNSKRGRHLEFKSLYWRKLTQYKDGRGHEKIKKCENAHWYSATKTNLMRPLATKW